MEGKLNQQVRFSRLHVSKSGIVNWRAWVSGETIGGRDIIPAILVVNQYSAIEYQKMSLGCFFLSIRKRAAHSSWRA